VLGRYVQNFIEQKLFIRILNDKSVRLSPKRTDIHSFVLTPQDGGVMYWLQFVWFCLCVCEHRNSNSYRQIFLKSGEYADYRRKKSWLNFWKFGLKVGVRAGLGLAQSEGIFVLLSALGETSHRLVSPTQQTGNNEFRIAPICELLPIRDEVIFPCVFYCQVYVQW